ncbi:MAG: LiaF transmembrane domain-containing protein [Oscillospiraceae bacterium]|jgi:predicted membrane protein
MKKSTLSIILGLIIILFGIFFGGQAIGYWEEYEVSFDGWWTLFIIIPCVISVFNSGLNMFNSIGTGVGVLLLLSEQYILKDDIGYKLIVPYVLIVFGLSLIFRKSIRIKNESTNGIFAGSKGENYFAVFGGNTPQFNGVDFRGANAYAVFGGVELKLQNAIIRRDCVINAYSIFGGTDIVLPKNVRVIVNSTPIFGGVENSFISEAADNAPTVLIRALSVFGGTDIK